MKFYAEIDLKGKINPLYPADLDTFRKVKKDTPVRIEIVAERNYEFHKKVLALFNLGYENQPEGNKINSFDNYRKIYTMKAGYVETEITDRGVAYFAKSISFANMDDHEFSELFNKLLDVVAKALDSEPEDIRSQVYDFM